MNGNGPVQRLDSNNIQSLLCSPPENMDGILKTWKKNGIIQRDPLPAIYVYYQYFHLNGTGQPMCRKGFICDVKIEDWEAGVVLNHEEVIPDASEFQYTLLEQTRMHINPIHALYADPSNSLDALMEESMCSPLLEFKDVFSVNNKIGRIQDKKVLALFAQVLSNKTIVVADGHHRYTAALKQKNKNRNPLEQYMPMHLTNIFNNDIPLLPFHRLVKLTRPDLLDAVLHGLDRYFTVQSRAASSGLEAEIGEKLYAFGFVTDKSTYIIELKPEMIPEVQKEKRGTAGIIEKYIIDKIFKNKEIKPALRYVNHLETCVEEVQRGNADFAIVLKAIGVEEVVNLSQERLVLPAKSTYFYPKVVSGLIMNSTMPEDGGIAFPCEEEKGFFVNKI